MQLFFVEAVLNPRFKGALRGGGTEHLFLTFKYKEMKRQIKLRIPKQMQLLCCMLEIEPETVLQNFADDLSIASEIISSDDRRKMATEYLYRCSTDNETYKQDQLRLFFDELNAMLEKWPNDKRAFKSFLRKWPQIWASLRSR